MTWFVSDSSYFLGSSKKRQSFKPELSGFPIPSLWRSERVESTILLSSSCVSVDINTWVRVQSTWHSSLLALAYKATNYQMICLWLHWFIIAPESALQMTEFHMDFIASKVHLRQILVIFNCKFVFVACVPFRPGFHLKLWWAHGRSRPLTLGFLRFGVHRERALDGGLFWHSPEAACQCILCKQVNGMKKQSRQLSGGLIDYLIDGVGGVTQEGCSTAL